jgi:hypothetical protein
MEDLRVTTVDIDKEEVKQVMFMWMSGIYVQAIANYFKKSVQDINHIIDVYQEAFV